MLATGRMRRSALSYALDCGTNGPVICYQGALTVAAGGVGVIRHERLRPEEVAESLAMMRAHSAHINLYLGDEVYIEASDDWAEAYAGRMQAQLNKVDSLDALIESGPTVVMGVNGPDATAELAGSLRARLGNAAAVTHSLPRFCEVTRPNAQKRHALQHLAAHAGFAAGDVIAIGNGPGDAGMIGWAGLGVAIEGSDDEALAAADEVIAGPEDNGVATLLRRLVREGRLGG